MGTDRARFEANERVDLEDFGFISDEMLNAEAEQTGGNFLTDPSGKRQWILEGFAIDNPVGNQIRVTKGRSILSRREGGVITHGMVTTEGDATKIIDTTGFAAATHGIFIRFEFVGGDTESRIFWNAAGVGSEFSQAIATRRLANWSMRIEQTNPGGEWFKIGEVILPALTITDQRDFYFEGKISDTFANTWGGGTDRDSNRETVGIKDLQEFTAAVRTLFEQLRPSGARWWNNRGLDVTGVNASETGVTGRGNAPNGIGTEGFGDGTGTGVKGTGGDTDGTGVTGEGGTSNGIGVEGNGTGVGAGVKGTGGVLGGHGIVADADATSPQRSSLLIMAQDDDPIVNTEGSVYIHSENSKMSINTGSVWERIPSQSLAIIATENETVVGNFTNDTLSIPTNALRIGSTVRIRAAGQVNFTSGSGVVTVVARIGGVTVGTASSIASISANTVWSIDALVTIRAAPSASSAIARTSLGFVGSQEAIFNSDADTLATNGSLTVDIRLAVFGITGSVDLEVFVVDYTNGA